MNDSTESKLAAPESPKQGEMPFAMVMGHAVTELPKDLYIPPDALEVFLEAFEGPLDLLLYLIKRQNLDILAINVAAITKQYVAYVEAMNIMQFELAADYLVMAALLAEIKSRMLLPQHGEEEELEDDPRAQLILRLQEYERFKLGAESLNELPRMGRDIYPVQADIPDIKHERPHPEVELRELLIVFSQVMHRADMFRSHQVSLEKLSTRERMAHILDRLQDAKFLPFIELFQPSEGRLGVVVTFLATMELVKEALIEVVQSENFGPIHIKAKE
jgi:segregation and condensation protein A